MASYLWVYFEKMNPGNLTTSQKDSLRWDVTIPFSQQRSRTRQILWRKASTVGAWMRMSFTTLRTPDRPLWVLSDLEHHSSELAMRLFGSRVYLHFQLGNRKVVRKLLSSLNGI